MPARSDAADLRPADAQPCGTITPQIGTAPAGGRVDVHAHVIPPFYRTALLENGQGPAPGGSVLIAGAGPIGLVTAQVARARLTAGQPP